MRKQNDTLKKLIYTAMLSAMVFLLSYFPIKIFAIEMTLCVVPVVLGAIVLGKYIGAILGGVFGLCSFLQCLGVIFPLSAFGEFMLSLNPLFCVLICFVPRILMGYLSGLLFSFLEKFDKTKFISYFAANIAGALLNTVLFTGGIILLFWNNEAFGSQMELWGISMNNIWAFVTAFVAVNGIVEAAFSAIVGTAVSKTVHFAVKKMN